MVTVVTVVTVVVLLLVPDGSAECECDGRERTTYVS